MREFRLDAHAGGAQPAQPRAARRSRGATPPAPADDELAPLGEYLARCARCADVSLLPHKTWRAALREQGA